MSPLAARVATFLRSRALVAPGDRLIIALSGGPDSVALLHLMVECARSVRFTVCGVAHLNHGLRGADAEADEAFCRSLADRQGLPAFVERENVAALARDQGRSIEAAGHAARDAFYRRAMEALEGTLVATGHTADDVAESVLMHVGRGSGLRGLAAIRPRAGHLIRPLLRVERPDIQRYLDARSLPFRLDQSNADVTIARNRVRHRVVPVLRETLSPGVVGALGRLADLAAEDESLLEDLARQHGAGIVRAEGDARRIDLRALAHEPLAIRRRLVGEALRAVGRLQEHGLAHVDAALALAVSGRQGARLALPGVAAHVSDGHLVLRPSSGQSADATPSVGPARPGCRSGSPGNREGTTLVMRQVPVPGVLVDERGRWEITVRLGPPLDQDAVRQATAGGLKAVLDADRAGTELFVRSRRPGDRVRPLGMAGHRKLQDVFVDARVPRPARDEVPLVVDASGRIVWVVGHCVSEDVRLTDTTKGVLLLGFRALGG